MIEWLCDRWGIEKKIDAPDYIVGLGSGVLKSSAGELTRAGRNVVDKCFSLYRHGEGLRGIIIAGGKPWRYPPFSDAELMHRRLFELKNSTEELELPAEKLIVLDGDNTYGQVCAIGRFHSNVPTSKLAVVCPRLQTRRLRALLGKQGLLDDAGILPVEDGCEPFKPVERFRWSKAVYLLREMLAFAHHRLAGWL